MKKNLIKPEIEVVKYNVAENITLITDEVFSYEWDVDTDEGWQ